MIARTYEDIKVSLLRTTENPKQLLALALDTTQKRDPKTRSKDGLSNNTIRAVYEMNHGSVFEHIYFTFFIEGASRSFLAQITRHRMASFTSGSQHYQDYSDFQASFHPSMSADIEVAEAMKNINELYKRLIKRGIDKSEARQVLPNCAANNLLITINARSLANFFNLRICRINTIEILTVAIKMRGLVRNYLPGLFDWVGPDCVEIGKCSQKKRTCGRPYTWDELNK